MATERQRRRITVAVSALVGIGLWEMVGLRAGAAFLASPQETVLRLAQLAETGHLLTEVGVSLRLFFVGFVVATFVGVTLGLLLARVRRVRIALEDYITMLYATPMIALIPFILALMGFGFVPKVLVVFLFAVFPVLYNTVEGARSIEPALLEVARIFHSTEWALWRDVMIPYTLPYAMAGIRQAIARGLVGMVAAEFFLGPSGLGQLIIVSSYNFDTGGMLGAIGIIAALGILFMRAVQHLEGRLVRWKNLQH